MSSANANGLEVVVRAGLKVFDLFLGRITCREYEDRDLLVLPPNSTQQLRAVETGQHQIENDEVIVAGLGEFPPGQAIISNVNRKAFGAQGPGNELRYLLLILNE